MCETAEYYYSKFPRASRDYTCYECRASIPKGQQYWRYGGKWDGEHNEFVDCLFCATLVYIANRDFDDFCWYAGDLQEGLRNESEWTPAPEQRRAARRVMRLMSLRNRWVRRQKKTDEVQHG